MLATQVPASFPNEGATQYKVRKYRTSLNPELRYIIKQYHDNIKNL